MPQKLLSSFLAVTAVVPEPKKGSKTMSPRLELAKINLAMSFSGFWVGWSVFSAMDQSIAEVAGGGLLPVLGNALFPVRGHNFLSDFHCF